MYPYTAPGESGSDPCAASPGPRPSNPLTAWAVIITLYVCIQSMSFDRRKNIVRDSNLSQVVYPHPILCYSEMTEWAWFGSGVHFLGHKTSRLWCAVISKSMPILLQT